MKKTISVLIAVLVVISLCGCGNKTDNKIGNDILSRVLIADEGQYSEEALNHTGMVSIEPIYTVDDSVESPITVTLNGNDLSLTYKDTVYFPMGDKQVYRYCVDSDENKIIHIDMNGNIDSIRHKYMTLDISKTSTPGEVWEKLKPELQKIRALSYYKFNNMPKQIQGDNGFGYYDFYLYNVEDDLITDYLYVAVSDDGDVTGLRIFDLPDLPDEECTINVNKDKLNNIIEARLKGIYDTNSTKYLSFEQTGDSYYLTVYKGEYYLECYAVARYIQLDSESECSSYITLLLVPLELVNG